MSARKPQPSGPFTWTLLTAFLLSLSALMLWIAFRILPRALSHAQPGRAAWGHLAFVVFGASLCIYTSALRIAHRVARTTATGRVSFEAPIPSSSVYRRMMGPGQALLGLILIWSSVGAPHPGLGLVYGGLFLVIGSVLWRIQRAGQNVDYLAVDASGLTVSSRFLRYQIPLNVIEALYANDEFLFIQVKDLDSIRTTVTLGNGNASPKALARFDRWAAERQKRRGFPFAIETFMTYALDPVILKYALERQIGDPS